MTETYSISIGDVRVSLPAIPGVHPKVLAGYVAQKLEERDYDFEFSENISIEALDLAPLQAMAGESATSLASRIARAVEQSLANIASSSSRPWERKSL